MFETNSIFTNDTTKKISFNNKDAYIIISSIDDRTYYWAIYFEHEGLFYKIKRSIETNKITEENYINETLKDVFNFK